MTFQTPSKSGPGRDRRPYYAQGAVWSDDVLNGLRRSRRTAWTLAGIAVSAAAMNGVALIALGPIHRAVPFVVEVNRQADFALTARKLASGTLQSDPHMIEAYAARYVTAREGYRPAQVLDDYRLTTLFSGAEQRSVYVRTMAKTGPTSPLNLYPPDRSGRSQSAQRVAAGRQDRVGPLRPRSRRPTEPAT